MPKEDPAGRKKAQGAGLESTESNSSLAGQHIADGGTGALFFYGHSAPPHDFLSQHFLCTFTAPSPFEGKPDMTFQSTEQFMMYHKALLFDDIVVSEQIMQTLDPKRQKALGRQVAGFSEEVWKANREKIVEEGNWNKFMNAKDSALKDRLLKTGDKELVEAAPLDRIWGIGFGKANAESQRSNWGLNLLGKALMKVRDRIRAEELADESR